MSDIKKDVKVPDVYDPVQMQKIFDSFLGRVQSTDLSITDGKPPVTHGNDHEMRLDPKASKLYIKIAGTWKSTDLT